MGLDSLASGQVFAGDFVVERRLSEGGMGVVYVVVQQSTGKRRALKVMQPQLVMASDPAQTQKNQQRFMAEARAGGAIQSEHVVEVITAGVDAHSGAPWMAMELLDGNDLDAELKRRGQLPPGEFLALFEQLCHALAAAHRAGVLHLDLKPENIFLSRAHRAGGGTTVKVLDFGISRMVSEHKRSATVTTAVGSPFWMSPEQSVRGGRVGAHTDVWALGLIAFRALTGRHYWREANVPSGEVNITGWLLEMMTGAIDPASVRAQEYGVAMLLPQGFDAWFARCVTRDLSARFSDVAGCYAALVSPPQPGGYVATQPLLQPPPALARPLHEPSAHMTQAVAGMAAPYSPQPYGAMTAPIQAPVAPVAPVGAPRSRGLKVFGAVVAAGVLISAIGWALVREPERAREAPVAPAAPTPPAVVIPVESCRAGMVLIPAATFLMGAAAGQGSEGDQPEHAVAVRAFCIDRTEVTVAAYRSCVEAGRCLAAPALADWPEAAPSERARLSAWCNADRADRADHPVNCVDWPQATAYCAWASGRLPTEAEWEYAARGTDGRMFPWGNQGPAPTLLNACGSECVRLGRSVRAGWDSLYAGDDGWATTSPVGRYASGASPFGLLDMAGNVLEWTSDWHGPYHPSPVAPDNPSGPREGNHRVIRGGSWRSSDDARVRIFRDLTMWRRTDDSGVGSTVREWAPPVLRDPILGFRCAKDVTSGPSSQPAR